MVVQRLTPHEYFENRYTLQDTVPQNKDYTALIIFGAICVVAITAMVLAHLKK